MRNLRNIALAALALTPLAAVADDHAAKAAAADPVLADVVAGDWRSRRSEGARPLPPPGRVADVLGPEARHDDPRGAARRRVLVDRDPRAVRQAHRWRASTRPAPDLDNPELSEGARKARADFEARYGAKPDLYGKVGVVNWGAKSKPLPKETYDFILTRALDPRLDGHARHAREDLQGVPRRAEARRHPRRRAASRQSGPAGSDGRERLRDRGVRDRAGREGAASSWRAAPRSTPTPKDTKDHPFGVWTLPPALRSTPYGSKETDPSFDHSKYLCDRRVGPDDAAVRSALSLKRSPQRAQRAQRGRRSKAPSCV